MKKHLQASSFKIYNASAGSGKTHTLVKEYLKIVLGNPYSFKNILAITFTNKAVNEMKERILTNLFDFSLADPSTKNQNLFKELLAELQLTPDILRKKSEDTLKHILHNYAYFDVSTIDKFTHRVIRTFAKDLKLPQNFEPVVETNLLLDEAVSRVIQKAGSDDQLTKVLVEFALEKIDDNRSWDIAFDLDQIGKLIFQENHAAHLEKLTTKRMEDFLDLKKIVAEKISSAEKKMIGTAEEILTKIKNSGLQFEDFSGSYFPKFMQRIVDGDFNIDLKKAWIAKFDSSPLYPQRVAEETKSILDNLQDNFVSLFLEIQSIIPDYLFLKNVYRNIVPLTVLNIIQKEVDAIGRERDQIPIFKFNQIISKEIKNQPAPFIYERLGEKYKHYFIDEFQDTSATQWYNLIPLINNALASEGGTLFLVGDAKQAIYRWRGGKAEQLLAMANEAENPFVIHPVTERLDTNYRSLDQVVEFNNDFFTWSSAHLSNSVYENLFIEGNEQKTNSKKGGLVKIHFVEKTAEKNLDELYCEQVYSFIKEARGKGHPLGDITILVRSNKKGVLLADYLSEEDIPIISSESLLLNSSSKVRFLINLLQYANSLKEAAIAYEILSFLAPSNEEKHQFISGNLNRLEKILNEEFDFSLGSIERLSTYDGLEYAIRQFDLAPSSDAYIVFLMDFVLDVEQKEGGAVHSFLRHWEKKKEKLAIASPENMDAIRIMTIHKAKGLEFPVVIFPFVNERIYKRTEKKIWAPTDAEEMNGFDELLLVEKDELSKYANETAVVFEEEKQKMELDAMNVLYVALTRAEKALYIVSEKKPKQSSNQKINSYSDLLINYLIEKNLWNNENATYNFGALEVSNEVKAENNNNDLQYQYSYRDRPNFNIITKSGMLWDDDRKEAIEHGTFIHYILSLIKTHKDLDIALAKVLRDGDIAKSQLAQTKKKVEEVLRHPELTEFFTEKYNVMNERAILTKEGKLLRPDRISILNNELTLIDYKTGMKNPKYKEQLYAYSDALENMGFSVKKKIIVYINEEVNLEFI